MKYRVVLLFNGSIVERSSYGPVPFSSVVSVDFANYSRSTQLFVVQKRRIGARSDTGGTCNRKIGKSELIESQENKSQETELRSIKSTPVVISDEDLDLEIEKIRSMKNNTLSRSRTDSSPIQASNFKTPSPVENNMKEKNIKNICNNYENVRKETPKMVQENMTAVEEKLTSLKIVNKKESPKKGERKTSTENNKDRDDLLQRQSSEEDSANHSPSDVMLASPSLSSISDNHSEGSSDGEKRWQ
ncbi:hypothetical protein NQ317_014993 [Molorchus minor]|uniref:Uncharacterized protein n=1 Tax=Molorchus minor TaxID=1323400 RepID=A0ABQ9J6N5_9CUCU|nr:hypothetical protein NQ317_014993 [Molorchus minor]